MKLFICNRSIDKELTERIIEELLITSEHSIAVQQEVESSENWKILVEKKMKESDFVLFAIGSNTFESDQIKWEYSKAKTLNKQIIGYKLSNASQESILFCQGFQVFEKIEECFKFLSKTYEDDRKLKFEQYKIMVSSTEKVTENRMKVNNLFFTITSSILSIGFVLGKSLEFSIPGIIGMIVITGLSLIISYSWEKLIQSYAFLNRGKFIVIDKIEKQLRTNMFEDEWQILKNEIKYVPNSQTETEIIKYFRNFIYIIGVCEILYLLYLLNNILPKCQCC